MAHKYIVETFGCQMNHHDAERIAGILDSSGYEPAAVEQEADIIVINTCSVRERAEEKLYSRLGEIRDAAAERGLAPVVAVTGCVAQQEGSALFENVSPVHVVAGTRNITDLPALIARARATERPQINVHPHDDVSFPFGVARRDDPVRAWVTIIEGCNEFCSFCVVPYTRGHEVMRPAADIVAEVQHAVDSGRCEVQLLGQIVNHYRDPTDDTCDFSRLLERVHDVPGLKRIRFASPHPRHVSDRLATTIRDLPKVCKHLHLPVQSGSNEVLARMRRRHTREDYLDLVQRLRSLIPAITLSTDVIVGFPGETDVDFDATMDLVTQVRFQAMYSFKYSVRPNTLASKRMADDVQEASKTSRIVRLQALQAGIQMERHRAMVGSVETVLVEGLSRRRTSDLAGKTEGHTTVNFPGPLEWRGRLIPVRITEATPNAVRGEAVVG